MKLLRTCEEMTRWADEQRAHGRSIGLVPTMGYLHDGHASLMDRLRPECDLLVVSIYVNPLQFAPHEDLDTYPRNTEGDLKVCEAHGVDAVFLPDALYPDDFTTVVHVKQVSDGLCGNRGPQYFQGIATAVARLFGVTRATCSCFGEKDYQQLMVIRRMVRDLAFDVRIVPAPLVRDPDGLAMSSRNAYLSAEDRQRGLTLSAALRTIQQGYEQGITDVQELLASARDVIDADFLDYLEIRDADNLQPLSVLDRPARALVAVMVGKTRLIDNMAVGPALAGAA